MNPLNRVWPCVASLVAMLPAAAMGQPADTDTCLFFSAENIVEGPGNWYCYAEFSAQAYTFQKGDRLEYDILMPAGNPLLKGGIDADLKAENLPAALNGRPWVRDAGLVDQEGLKLHGDAILKPAENKWYHRVFDLSPLAGCSAVRWNVVFEGDAKGQYTQFLANIRVTHDGKSVLALHDGGPAPVIRLRQTDGYSRSMLVTSATPAEAADPAALPAVLKRAEDAEKLRAAQQRFRSEIDLTRRVAKKTGDEKVLTEIDQAEKLEDAAALKDGRAGPYIDSLARARAAMPDAAPLMRQLTGHLVGHAHIDLQWLWTWDETINQIIPDTFGQAVKFMGEFPEFTFTQSTAALYFATEQYHPELFAKIKKYVAEGRWEIVGGRWCEGDMNMISPESHARHVLYAQRYFQDRFGKTCSVAFEPDTFGHTWQMPQILKKGGMESYYFCRGGKKHPLFWWEGPDGSQILAFEESALGEGAWYIDVINDDKVRELADFTEATGAKDHLMVYGVGNHGGGPTREHILAGVAMKDRSPWPTVRFSTMTEFFRRLHAEADKLKLPTVKDELNPVFEGCYTSHALIKRGNRQTESLLEATEVWASLAAVEAGRPYPREALRDLWLDVLWNHHHDTLPGSFKHAPALYSQQMYESMLARGERLREGALEALAGQVQLDGAGPHVLVFNPLAWPRSEVVDVELTVPVDQVPTELRDEGGPVPTQLLGVERNGETARVRLCFLAREVNACGCKAFHADGLKKAAEVPLPDEPHQVSAVPGARPDGSPAPGVPEAAIRSQLVVLHELPGEMSAWTLGKIDKETPLDRPVFEQVVESGPVRWRVRRTFRFENSTITEDTITYAHTRQVDFDTSVEWLQIGTAKSGGSMLKAAFATGIAAETATAEVPFADISRPTDGHEYVTQKWCDVSDASRGVTILNDCKHGYDAKGGTLRLTLLRSSYDPDPVPDVGTHRMRYAAVPHDGPLDKLAAAHAGWAFNKPMSVVVRDRGMREEGPKPKSQKVEKSKSQNPDQGIPTTDREGAQQSELLLASSVGGNAESVMGGSAKGAAGKGALPSNVAGCRVVEGTIIVTALKQAEDDTSLILRAYECTGKPTTARIELGFAVSGVTETDLLERDLKATERASMKGNTVTAEFTPYEIRTLRVKLGSH